MQELTVLANKSLMAGHGPGPVAVASRENPSRHPGLGLWPVDCPDSARKKIHIPQRAGVKSHESQARFKGTPWHVRIRKREYK